MITQESGSGRLPLGRKIWSVNELTAQIQGAIEGLFQDVWVEGEVFDLKVAGSGHAYFTLKDSSAQLRAVLFRVGGRFLSAILKEGRRVRVRGRLVLYALRGAYQLAVDYVEPAGIGALQTAIEALKGKLRDEGLFDAERKVPIPLFPRRVILITSSTGAVVHDMLTVLRSLPIQVHLLPVPVQGEGAAAEIAHAIDRADRACADLLILARGGGALEDLWAFNAESVAYAIARCSTPIISAVGHETDVTIADFVADLRAPTPSLAAETVARSVRLVLERFSRAQATLQFRIGQQIEMRRNRLKTIARGMVSPLQRLSHQRHRALHLTLRTTSLIRHRLALEKERWRRGAQGLTHLNPCDRLVTGRERLCRAHSQLCVRAGKMLQWHRTHLVQCVARMDALSPLAVLGRGYSLTRTLSDLAIIRSADQVAVGDPLHLTLHRGALVCTVDAKPGH